MVSLAWYNKFSRDSSILRPIPLTIYKATTLVVRDITVLQSPFWNFFVSDSKGMWALIFLSMCGLRGLLDVSACLTISTFIWLQRSLVSILQIQSSHFILMLRAPPNIHQQQMGYIQKRWCDHHKRPHQKPRWLCFIQTKLYECLCG